MCSNVSVCFFCFNDTATTEIYTLSLHDALPICSMRDRGMGLIYISHRMEEVWELADRVTVFRDGKLIGTRDMRTEGPDRTRPGDIVRMMVGREISDLYVRTQHPAGEVRLSVRDLTGPGGIGR